MTYWKGLRSLWTTLDVRGDEIHFRCNAKMLNETE